jgi:hypothetical protein
MEQTAKVIFITGLVLASVVPARSGSVNRADIRLQTLRRRAIVLEVSLKDQAIVIVSNQVQSVRLPTGQLEFEVPVAQPNKPVDQTKSQPTPVVFINKETKTSFLIQQQPAPEKRRAACVDKLNLTTLLTFCETLTLNADDHARRVCDDSRAVVDGCAGNPTFDVSMTVNLVPPGGSFETHMTSEDETVEYIVQPKPEEAITVGAPRKVQPVAVRFKRVDGEVSRSEASLVAAIVPLDSTGVASWRYMNPMNPACIRCNEDGELADASAVDVAFENRTVDRSFVVSLHVPKDVAAGVTARGLAKCKPNKACTVSVKVPPLDRGVFDAALINSLPMEQLIRFDLTFFDETARVPNPSAYLRQVPIFASKEKPAAPSKERPAAPSKEKSLTPTLEELESQTSFAATAKLGAAAEPDTGQAIQQSNATFASAPCRLTHDPIAPSLCAANPFLRAERHHDVAAARLDIAQNLGSRADAAVTVGLRSSTDLGGKDDGKLALTQYLINVYSRTRFDLGLQFGRTTFLDAANSIALNEKGDGYRWIARVPGSQMTASFTHILKRESEAGTADRRNLDNHELVFQLRGIHLPSKKTARWLGRAPRFFGLRSADILVMLGNEKGNVPGVDGSVTALSPYHYRTIGGEAFYAFPKVGCLTDSCAKNYGSIAGSVAAFRSSRHVSTASADCASALCDGRGTVALLTATWAPKFTSQDDVTSIAKQALTLLLGMGSGDRARTASRDEGYVGETAAFAPDVLFLSTFEPAMDSVQRHPIGQSLSNKDYLGIQFADNTYSPLEWVARLLRVAPNDVESKATILRIHDYRFREPVNGSRSAAREVNLDFQIESPKGVNVTVGAARMWPGLAIRPVIQHAAWALNASVSVKLAPQ